MITCRRFSQFSSTKLGNYKHPFEVLNRLAKNIASFDDEKFADHLQEASERKSIVPLNAVLASWENEYLKSPTEALHPREVLDKIDEWKDLVDSVAASNSLQCHLQQHLEGLLRPDVKSYTLIIQAVCNSIDEHSRHKRKENQNKLHFVDSLLERLIKESRTDLSIRPNISSFSAVMNAWAKSGTRNNNMNSKKVEELLRSMEILSDEDCPNLQPNIVIYNTLLNAWAKDGEVAKIEDTLQRMIRLEIPSVSADTISYTTLLSAYARLRTPEAALKADSLLQQMLELYHHGMESAKPNVIAFSTVMQCHAQLGDGEKAEDWLQQLQELYHRNKDPDFLPDLAVYNTVVHAWVKSGQPEKAEDFLRLVMINDENENDNGNDIVLSTLPNSRTFNMIISAWAKAGEPDRAEATLMEMQRLYVEDDYDTCPCVISYNTVLDSYAQKMGRILNYDKKNARMKKNHRKNNKQLDIPDHAEDAPWNRAEAILDHMIDLYRKGNTSVKPNARTWNTVINVCAKAGRIDQAEAMLERFTSFSTPSTTDSERIEEDIPSVRTWNVLLSSCTVKGDVNKAKHFWQRMSKHGIEPDIVSYNTLLNCYAHSSKIQNRKEKLNYQKVVTSIIHRLRHDPNVTPNHITYLAIVNFWINQGLPTRAESFLLDITIASQQPIQNKVKNTPYKKFPAPNRSLFHYVMGDYKAPKKAEQLLLKMAELSDDRGFDIRPNTETYNILLNCWAKSMKAESGERAEVILREMEGLGHLGDVEATPNISTYNIVLNAWSNSGNAAAALTRIDKLIFEMILKGNPSLMPDSASYGTWLKAITLSKESDKKRRVEDVVKTMKIHDYKPSSYISQRIQEMLSTESVNCSD